MVNDHDHDNNDLNGGGSGANDDEDGSLYYCNSKRVIDTAKTLDQRPCDLSAKPAPPCSQAWLGEHGHRDQNLGAAASKLPPQR